MQSLNMCGIAGIVGPPAADEQRRRSILRNMRDRLSHRGPDDAANWFDNHVAFANRRLAIRDPRHGQQPWIIGPDDAPDGVLTYNGEIYNAPQLRRELSRDGVRFTSQCDTEVVAHMLHKYGTSALQRLRGMFALAWYEPATGNVTLARDALGIKPLAFARIRNDRGWTLVFASEPAALRAHPEISDEPDWSTVSAYLTTIRTTLGDRSLYRDIRVLTPGSFVRFKLNDPTGAAAVQTWWTPPAPVEPGEADLQDITEETRRIIDESVQAHRLSDRPVAALLSGGLDSAIIARSLVHGDEPPHTFCAGDPDDPKGAADLEHARLMADLLGTWHHEVNIERDTFSKAWPELVTRLRSPLSTPNEVAIHALSNVVATHAPVALTGEGADELFAGYGVVIDATEQNLAQTPDASISGDSSADIQTYMNLTSWIPMSAKSKVLLADVTNRSGDDVALHAHVASQFDAVMDGRSQLDRHLAVHRWFNLTGLLTRLDTATMLASVEGRTPYADRVVAEFAMSIPAAMHCGRHDQAHHEGAVQTATRTKHLLRQAYGGVLPASVVTRPKQSFPLPFQGWLSDLVPLVRDSSFAHDVFQPTVWQQILEAPQDNWMLAWPLMNLALWGDRR